MGLQSGSNFGTQTATVTTEHTLATVTSAEDLVLYVDTNAMALGDKLILRVKEKVLTGGTTRTLFEGRYAHVQQLKIKQSRRVYSLFETVFTLEQSAGTGRSFPWSVVKQGSELAPSQGPVTFTGSTNEAGITCIGAGTGAGLIVTGGATGPGLQATGGATSGDGINATANGGGNGINAIGVGANAGLRVEGGTTGPGIHAHGGASGATPGVEFHAHSATGPAFELDSDGSGNALELVSATGSAVSTNLPTQITADMDSNSTQLAAIVADTNELQVAHTNGNLGADIDKINGTAIVGDGSTTPFNV